MVWTDIQTKKQIQNFLHLKFKLIFELNPKYQQFKTHIYPVHYHMAQLQLQQFDD